MFPKGTKHHMQKSDKSEPKQQQQQQAKCTIGQLCSEPFNYNQKCESL